MKTRKTLLISLIILVMTFLMLTSIFSQVRAGETIPFTGVIKTISQDLKYILITDDIKIFISSDTKIFDRKGNSLKVNDLKPQLYVAVEAVQNRDGFLAKKIVIKKREGV